MHHERSQRRQSYEALEARCTCARARALPPVRTLTLAGIVLGSIGGGALLGAALSALLFPASARELRRKLARFLSAPEGEEDDTLAAYDSGEHVLEEASGQRHHGSDYPSIAQPTSEDDALSRAEEGPDDILSQSRDARE